MSDNIIDTVMRANAATLRGMAIEQAGEIEQLKGRLATLDAEASAMLMERDRVMRERNESRAIIEGRAKPPTEEEIHAHALRSGRWLLRIDQPDGRRLVYVLDAGRDDARAEARAGARDNVRWWSLHCGGWPCAWPVAGGA